ncbi:MAG: MBL fold metallo-hydrolase [Anaerolineales bacterium]|nr:MBL fold metallo-hydrolase [Anaerolineales bacterium]
MKSQIQTIPLPMPFHMGLVNSYLIQMEGAFFLIDTGSSSSRKVLVEALKNAGCQPGLLKLILLTHGDYDHTGNAAYLRSVFGAKIAMHAADVGMLVRGDMFEGRKSPNVLIRILLPMLSGFGKAERCAPDILLLDGEQLSAYGLDARVISIPGHSQGSIGILTEEGELFCGDLLENLKKPALGSIMDDVPTARTSLQKLRDLNVQVIFPGHGHPFQMHELTGE